MLEQGDNVLEFFTKNMTIEDLFADLNQQNLVDNNMD
jgi:hypothetical protein